MTRPTSAKRRTLPTKYESGFLQRMDGRTEVAQRLRQNFGTIADEVGGDLSHVKAALVERFVFLEAVMATTETEIAASPANAPALIGSWVQQLNAMVGLSKVLGIERRAKDVPALSDYIGKGSTEGRER